MQADLADAGDAYAVVRGHDAVIHAAALPDPQHNPPHTVFQNNLMAAFNTLEAAVRFGVPRFVNVSSETVPGFFFPERPFLADYAPVDEEHPVRPQDPYALAKSFGEQLMDAAVRRSDIAVVSVRPSWVQWEGNYERNLGPVVRAAGAEPSAAFWSYIDAYDLAGALLAAAEAATTGHEVVYIASPDNATGRPLAELVRRHHGDAVEVREPLAAPGRRRHHDREGRAAARLGAGAHLARLPRRAGPAAPRGRASGSTAARPAYNGVAPRRAEPAGPSRARRGAGPCSRPRSGTRDATAGPPRRRRRCRSAGRPRPRTRASRGRRP